MNQHDNTQDLNNNQNYSLEYSETVSDQDYGQEEIKPFQLDTLFKEIERLLLSPIQLAGVSLVA